MLPSETQTHPVWSHLARPPVNSGQRTQLNSLLSVAATHRQEWTMSSLQVWAAPADVWLQQHEDSLEEPNQSAEAGKIILNIVIFKP